jgi:hypothetical protein
VLSLDRRRFIHVNVTMQPTAEWTALQLTQAFPFDTAPRFILRDRDSIYGDVVRRAISRRGLTEFPRLPKSGKQDRSNQPHLKNNPENREVKV